MTQTTSVEPSPSGPGYPDDMLPPVEPPSARFILQLFVYPLVIVCGIVGIGLLINWAVRSVAGNPQDYVEELKRNNNNRWQAASNLADALNNPVNAKYLEDPALAQELADLLDRELKVDSQDERDVTLRMYLCAALGKFHVDNGVDTLLQAATIQNGPSDVDVRKFALMALAKLGDNLPPERLRDDTEVTKVLLKSSDDTERQIQEAAAFALGVIGGERADERLVQMLAPTTPANARYNAATGLARRGNVRAVPVLVEMMDPDTAVGIEEEEKKSKDIKLASVIENGMKATRQLVVANPTAERTRLIEAVEQLKSSDLSKAFQKKTDLPLTDEARYRLIDEADSTLKALNETPSSKS